MEWRGVREGRNDLGDPLVLRTFSLFVVMCAAEEEIQGFFLGSYFLIVF